MSIFLTGSSGFVGKNIVSYFGNQLHINNYKKGSLINIHEDIVIHLAGKAHDLKNTANIEEYYVVNTELTKHVFDNFLDSEAKVFITLSSVKAVADELDIELTEDHLPNPITHYGKSKLFAEQYIFNKGSFEAKRVYILRPCMIHGPGNKGNLNLLFNIVNKRIPWLLGAYRNKRSFCSIDNLCFVIKELIENENIPSGIYNIADDEPISTNEIIDLISESTDRKSIILNIPKFLISSIAKFGDLLKLPLNTERLAKLTETYIVNNNKIKTAIGKQLPISSKDGLLKTFKSFSQNV
jgi:nucleoside-diphosphate-sugar epimerase